MPFDIQGARKAGYSDAEIADYLAGEHKFDIQNARKSGYGDAEIIQHLTGGKQVAPKAPASPNAKDPRARIADVAAGAFQGAVPDTLAGIVGAFTDLPGMVNGMYTNWRDNLRDAQSALKLGDYAQALSSAGAAIPIVGQAAEPILDTLAYSDSDYDRGRALGQAGAAIFGPKAMSGTAKVAGKAMKPVGEMLMKSAEKSMDRALGAGTKGDKLIAERIVPELVKRRFKAADLDAAAEKASMNAIEAGKKIGEAWDKIPDDRPLTTTFLMKQLDQYARDNFTIADKYGNRIPSSPVGKYWIDQIDDLKRVIRAASEEVETVMPDGKKMKVDVMKAKNLRELRRQWDQVADDAGAWEKVNPAQSSKKAFVESANRVRAIINDAYPDIAKLNQEFKLWADAEQVLSDTATRKRGQSGLLSSGLASGSGMVAGAVMGAMTGGVQGGLVGAAVVPYVANMVQKAVTSPGWKFASASVKADIADAIAARNPGRVRKLTQRFINPAVKQSPRVTAGDQQRQTLADLVR